MKSILVTLIALLLLSPSVVSAHNGETHSSDAKEVATASAIPTVNSFELFWPLAAGKTQGDSMYFLKTLKENIRGALIFGSAEKGEYQVFLATKRMLEVEVLLNTSKNEQAKSTLQVANALLTQSKEKLKISNGQDVLKDRVKNKLDSLIKLVDALAYKTQDNADTNEIHELLHNTHQLIEENLTVVAPK